MGGLEGRSIVGEVAELFGDATVVARGQRSDCSLGS